MTTNKIINYLDCYYRMIDYGETLAKIVADFVKKETNAGIQELIQQCKAILALPQKEKDKQISLIINNATDLDVTVSEMEQILKDTISLLCV